MTGHLDNMTRTYEVKVPAFPLKIELSKSRRPLYYKAGDPLPMRYSGDDYGFKGGRLVHLKTKKEVLKNPGSARKPRYTPVSGNALYTGMHERVRMSIINGLKASFLPHLPVRPVGEVLEYPVINSMNVYRTVADTMWDLDNFSILYFKAFHDLLKDEGKIPEDSIEYITGTQCLFWPVTRDENRMLIFELTHDDRDVIEQHLLYPREERAIVEGRSNWAIEISERADAGELMIDHDSQLFIIGIGKKHILWNSLRKVLAGIARHAMILNTSVEVSLDMYKLFADELFEKLTKKGIPVTINTQRGISEWARGLFSRTIRSKTVKTK